jgi:hypothetical protein
MKLTTRFYLRAGLVLCAAGALGAFGACKDGSGPPPPPPPSPAPTGIKAPIGLQAAPVSESKISLMWTDSTANETGFQLQRCTGANCTNFAALGANLAANTTTYSDEGLTANTSYSYRARAFNATDTSAWTATASATTGVQQGAPSFTMIGAGEITTCASSAGPMGTAHVVDSILAADPNAVAFTVGNNLTDSAQGSTFATCFDPKWGTFKAKTYYSIGNADFAGGRGPSGVYGYVSGGAKAGDASKGWYAFDKGNWHIVVLNTSDWEHGSTSTFGIDPQLNPAASEQVDFLAADLAAVPTTKCIAVISWERRFYTTGTSALGRNSNMRPMAGLMYQYGVDLLISAKDKNYSRFAPMEPLNGAPDPAGFRQFIVGTGGRSLDASVPGTAPATREAYLSQWGVLKLTMKDNSYDWQFINTQVPGGPSDTGTATCHN